MPVFYQFDPQPEFQLRAHARGNGLSSARHPKGRRHSPRRDSVHALSGCVRAAVLGEPTIGNTSRDWPRPCHVTRSFVCLFVCHLPEMAVFARSQYRSSLRMSNCSWIHPVLAVGVKSNLILIFLNTYDRPMAKEYKHRFVIKLVLCSEFSSLF